MTAFDLLYDFITHNEIATAEEINLCLAVKCNSIDTLWTFILVRTLNRNTLQCLEEGCTLPHDIELYTENDLI